MKQEKNLLVCSNFFDKLSVLSQVDPSGLHYGSGWHLVRCIPPGLGFRWGWHVVRLGQADFWSDVPPRSSLWVRLTFSQTSGQTDLWSDIPPDEALGQVDIWSDWVRQIFGQMYLPRISLWVRLTFSQTLGRLIFGQMYLPGLGFGSGWHLVRLWSNVPPAETCCDQMWY